MIRFGMKDRDTMYFRDAERLPQYAAWLGIIFFSYLLATLIIAVWCDATTNFNIFLYIQFFILYLVTVAIAIIRLVHSLYFSTTFFILDIIPIVGTTMRIVEKFYNVYLIGKRIWLLIVKSYRKTNEEEIEYRLQEISDIHDRLTSKLKNLRVENTKHSISPATKKIFKDMKKNIEFIDLKMAKIQ